jgi:hypothetical protein
VGPPTRRRIDPFAWEIDVPDAGTRTPLEVRFDRPLDFALASRSLQVAGIAGAGSVGPEELIWCFCPDEPWPEGRHELSVDADLEDVAGNSVRRVFDRDLARPEDDPLEIARALIPFETHTRIP